MKFLTMKPGSLVANWLAWLISTYWVRFLVYPFYFLFLYFYYILFILLFFIHYYFLLFYLEWSRNVCWPRLTYKRVEPVVSISWASCTSVLRKQFVRNNTFLSEANSYKRALALRNSRQLCSRWTDSRYICSYRRAIPTESTVRWSSSPRSCLTIDRRVLAWVRW